MIQTAKLKYDEKAVFFEREDFANDEELVQAIGSCIGALKKAAFQKLGEILTRIRAHQRHQSYLDGGVSFKRFWDEGNGIITALGEEASKLRALINAAQQGAPGDAPPTARP